MSGERKISDYPVNVLPIAGTDIVLGVRDLQGIPTTVTFNYGSWFANVSVPMKLNANLTANSVTANTLTVGYLAVQQNNTPSSSNVSTNTGSIWFDANYIYIGVSNNYIKRVPLVDF